MSEQPHGPTSHHQPDKAGNPKTDKGMLSGNKKWYLIGGLGLVAVLVLLFVRKSNANASGSTTSATTGLDPATEAALQSALQAVQSGGSGLSGMQGPAGATGAAGPAGPAGPASPAGNPGGTAPVTVGVPNEGGWAQVTFPTAAALQQFYNFAGVTAGGGYYPNNGDANRQAWITELNSLGATGYPPTLSASPSSVVPNSSK